MNEREIAYSCLCKIMIDKQYSNIVLRNTESVTPFVTQLVYGTLRNYRLLRQLWSDHVNKKPPVKLAVLLDMACYELTHMNNEQYATINEIVNLSKSIKAGVYSGLVNAVLRKVKDNKKEITDLAVLTSHPDWLLAMWKAHYGVQIAEQLCYEDLKEPRIALRVNSLETSEQQLLQSGKFTKGQLPGVVYYLGNILTCEQFKQGKVIIQSESSQQAVNTLGLQKGMTVLDVCAAPGSKTVQIAQILENTGKVVSNDLYDFRVELIKQNVEKYHLTNVECVNYDGTHIGEYYPAASFDAVLLDAPCSGLGTLKHKPEIKMNLTGQDIDDVVALQKQLLEAVAPLVKVNGVLLYSTCTLNKKENEKQIEEFLRVNEQFSLESQQTIFPFTYGSDGFYVAKLRRNLKD